MGVEVEVEAEEAVQVEPVEPGDLGDAVVVDELSHIQILLCTAHSTRAAKAHRTSWYPTGQVKVHSGDGISRRCRRNFTTQIVGPMSTDA